MNPLSTELDRYLVIRRSLGYDLGTTERILRGFIAFAERQGAAHIGTDLFLRWRNTFGRANQQTWATRLRIVRLFAQWLHGMDPDHEVPPRGLIPDHYRRVRPYIYSEDEIRRIVEAAAALPSVYGLRALTCSTLFGLIAVTGLRISEALSLDAGDIDLETGVLTLRRGKLGRARVLPLCESTTAQLCTYSKERDRLLGVRSEAFFVAECGNRLTDCGARYNFALVCQTIGMRPAEKFKRHGHGPRIHDLRHTFAVRTLIRWYQTGCNPAQEMIKLTTYLGHANPAHTYWYIEAVPELLGLASLRAETSPVQEVQS
jgi:integrase/recombinase XerD